MKELISDSVVDKDIVDLNLNDKYKLNQDESDVDRHGLGKYVDLEQQDSETWKSLEVKNEHLIASEQNTSSLEDTDGDEIADVITSVKPILKRNSMGSNRPKSFSVGNIYDFRSKRFSSASNISNSTEAFKLSTTKLPLLIKREESGNEKPEGSTGTLETDSTSSDDEELIKREKYLTTENFVESNENFDETFLTSLPGKEFKPRGHLRRGSMILPNKGSLHKPEKDDLLLMGFNPKSNDAKPFPIKRAASLYDIDSKNEYIIPNHRAALLPFTKANDSEDNPKINTRYRVNSAQSIPIIHVTPPARAMRRNTVAL